MSEKIKRYQNIAPLVEHSEAIFRFYPMATVYVRADDHDAALAAKDARIEELEEMLLLVIENVALWHADYEPDARKLLEIRQQQAEPTSAEIALVAATPPEDGRKVPVVVGYLTKWRDRPDGGIRIGRTEAAPILEMLRDDYPSALIDSVEPMMTVAQHERIVAAKDAEIARLNHALEVKEEFYQDALHSHIVLARQRDELRAQLDTNLNRRAIPEGLLERCAERLEYHMCSECKEATCCMPGTRAAAVELRALLGKEWE